MAQIQAAVNNLISVKDYESAQFFAERLVASDKSISNAYLLANVHFLNGNTKAAKDLLDPTSNHFSTVYLFGMCCYKLGMYQEGETALRRCLNDCTAPANEMAAAWNILGK
jgi:Anaphase-promoting complex, cyclosome, subunit 3